MTARDRSPEEVAEDLAEIKDELRAIRDRLDQRYVPRELYEARHTALRSEIALEMAALKAQQEADRKASESTRALSMWALGLVVSGVVALVGAFLLAGAGGAT